LQAKGGFEIYVDPTDDPDIREIFVVRRRVTGRSGRKVGRRRAKRQRTPKVEVAMPRNPKLKSRRQNLSNLNPLCTRTSAS